MTFEFKTGDKVRILRKAVSHENNWKNTWVSDMDRAVGQIGTVVTYIPERHDVTLDVPAAGLRFGYPDFILEKITERKFRDGDDVTVPASVNEVWAGTGIVENRFDNYVSVKMKTGGMTGRTGGFDEKQIILTKLVEPVIAPIVPIVPIVPARPAVLQGASVLEYARKIAVELAIANPKNRTTIDEVQATLTANNVAPAMLGNNAGQIFKQNFQNTGETIKSTRPGNRGRRIIVWQYVGPASISAPTSAPTAAPTGQKYIIEYRSQNSDRFHRSGNRTHDGKSLLTHKFDNLELAKKEADYQQKLMGNGYEYRVTTVSSVPVPTAPPPVEIPVAPVEKYIVEVRNLPNNRWQRSANLYLGKNLRTHEFESRAEAEKAAKFNQAKNSYSYRVVPVRTAPVSTPAPKFIVQFQNFNLGLLWMRSGNFTKSGLDLRKHEFDSLADAEQEAKYQESSGFCKYRAAQL